MEKEKQEVELPKPILIKDLDMIFPKENSKHKRRFGIYKCGFCGTEFKTLINSVKSAEIAIITHAKTATKMVSSSTLILGYCFFI
jgi:hypothetical protein